MLRHFEAAVTFSEAQGTVVGLPTASRLQSDHNLELHEGLNRTQTRQDKAL